MIISFSGCVNKNKEAYEISKIAYMNDDGKYQSFDEILEENSPDKNSKFALVICHENEALVVINFDAYSVKDRRICLPVLTLDVNNIREETVRMIVEWVSNKLTTGERGKYLYCPARNRKIKRIALKRRLDMLETEYVNFERRCM